ncbi:MAG: drug/metabolite transporter (DMT)-like permease [Paracoccaceae bacterium]|jgi:drug/metabolite transporter (DMT)-like permease
MPTTNKVTAKARTDRAQLGIMMMLVAYLCLALVDTSAKYLVLLGLPVFQVVFMRYVGHFALSLGVIGRGGFAWQRFATDHVGLVMLRSTLLVSSTVLNFIVLRYLSLTLVSAIMFAAPILVCALSWPLLGERVGPWRWVAIVVGFCGVLVVIRPFNEGFQWAVILPVVNALAMALYSILTRRLSGIVATETMQLYSGGLGTIVMLPFAIATWQTPANSLDWALLLGLGLWGWSGHELLTRAHGFAPANILMPYTYSFMIYLTITSYLVFDHIPDQWTLIGAGIIVVSGLMIWWRENLQRTRNASD